MKMKNRRERTSKIKKKMMKRIRPIKTRLTKTRMIRTKPLMRMIKS